MGDDDPWSETLPDPGAFVVGSIPGVDVAYPVQSDVVFARLSPGHIAGLQRDWTFHVWDERDSVVRWMTAFDTSAADVDAFLADIRATARA